MTSGRNHAIVESRADARTGCDVPWESAGSACPRLLQSDSTARCEFRGGADCFFLLYQQSKGEIQMKNPLDSLWGTIISGLVLTVILYFVVKSVLG
jgi:hypothetical protein